MRSGRIYVCRHSTSEWNELGRWQGIIDTKLSKKGIEQAKIQANTFVSEGVRFATARTSDLQRAQQTAKILIEPHNLKQRPYPDVRLRECYLGEFQGLTRNVIYGEKYERIFRNLSTMPHEERLDRSYFPGLETPREIAKRSLECLRDIASDTSTGEDALVVTHSVILKSLLAVNFDKYYEGIQMRTLSWMCIRWDNIFECERESPKLIGVDGIEFNDTFSPNTSHSDRSVTENK